MKKSFTLIELIVVIAIIAILAAIIAPNAFKAIEKAKIAEGVSDFKAYKTAILALYADTGHWVSEVATFIPESNSYHLYVESDNNDLAIDYSDWSGWDGPYLEKIKSKHPWGGTYALQSWNAGRGSNYDIWLDFEDDCYPNFGTQGCAVPDKTAIKIDQMLDDGDLYTGDILTGAASNQVPGDLSWIIYWDAYAFSAP
ncbi:MAG: prepilin-type N-terminal cleavage/methylation domain-containing protein [Candidatus Omnitrophica bacterium]|nr:prepilin-type N-terminal cleavage/methylation domain-containing protein [Candidatus Omnitrophota bacterium]MBU2044889.1 prepilin-type N-terminal cleavage/methylation domain-containing protein [Candidatus Omnitrophota bacterium]MBU2473269.1 prepilin-type N-terminal cleavage/methylation domain-containing protein [Candidatus Omnitrophota bacterium]